jgi:phosphoglycolate phosphatase
VLRAILFDLDGTLVDSLDDITSALVLALADHGLPAPDRETVRTWVGGGARNLVARAVAPALVEPVLARFRVHYAASPVVHTALYPGIAELLDALTASGVALAVLSNKPHALTEQIAERLLARWPFQHVHGHRDGVPLKPDPTAALQIARALDVAPEACAFVGDSDVDVLTGRAAGMTSIAVSWGFRPRAELEATAPSLLVDTPHALWQHLQSSVHTDWP